MTQPLPHPIPLTIMSFNIENGGTQIDFNKVVEAIQKSNADVIGIQEAWGNIDKLAQALHWKYFSRAQHIISKYPLKFLASSRAQRGISTYKEIPRCARDDAEVQDDRSLFVFIEVSPRKFVALANLHLPDANYGPELINNTHNTQHHINIKDVITSEQKIRLRFALPIIKKLAALAKSGMPVFVTGDFNSPSHLDWQMESESESESESGIDDNIKNQSHRVKVAWPVTKTFAALGFKDSYRTIYPDAHLHPGVTWPAMRPIVQASADGFNPSANDLPDRIDFIFADSETKIVSSNVIGEDAISPWPSDHRALVSSFEVYPKELDLAASPSHVLSAQVQRKNNNPRISISKSEVKIGEPFTISWDNAPGYRFDYIRINPASSNKLAWGEAVRIYTHAKTNGAIKLNAQNAKGNWLAWHVGEEGRWPLAPGFYDVKLMVDDGDQVLAATTIKVVE